MGKYLVIDGDVFLYRFAYAHQRKIQWDEETSSELLSPFYMARDDMEDIIVRILRAVDCEDYIIAFSDDRDFRFRVDPNYQANRKGKERPTYHGQLLEYAKAEHPWVTWPWLEADDVMGLMSTEQPGRVVLATIDKDLKQIPGELYNWNKGTFVTIPPEEADYFFWTQVLTGDTTDGVKGLPGIGPKKATIILDGLYGAEPKDYWAVVRAAYEERGLAKEYAIQQARLVRILRKGEYDYEGQRPKLWGSPVGKEKLMALNGLDPVLMGTVEKKIVEGILRLTEAHRILNHLKRLNGFECVPLESIVPTGEEEDGKDEDESKAVCSLTPESCDT